MSWYSQRLLNSMLCIVSEVATRGVVVILVGVVAITVMISSAIVITMKFLFCFLAIFSAENPMEERRRIHAVHIH